MAATKEENIQYGDGLAAPVLSEENPAREAAVQEYFITKSILNQSTYKEVFLWPVILKLCMIFFGALIPIAFFIQEYVEHIIVIAVVAFMWISFWSAFHFLRYARAIGTWLAEVKERTGSTEEEIIVSFTDDKINIYRPQTDKLSCYSYDEIKVLTETKNMYLLLNKEKRVILVNKISLKQEQKSGAFMRFIREKCKNATWKKMRIYRL